MSTSNRFLILLVALATCLVWQSPTPAQAANGVCPSGTSLFGRVTEVHGNRLLVKTNGPHGFETVYLDHAIIRNNNLRLRPGVFVGAFGCFTSNFERFETSEATLAYDASSYPAERHTETLAGIIHEVHGRRILVETGMPHGYVSIFTSGNQTAHVGDRIAAAGYFNPDGTFTATRVELPVAITPQVSRAGICPSATSLFGTLREIRGKVLLVKTTGPHGFESIAFNDAAINYNGSKLRPGVFVGAYGCFTPDYREFNASEITLSNDTGTYPTKRHIETLGGVVREVGAGRILVETGESHGEVTIFTPDANKVTVGQRVRATGSFNPNGTFSASSVQ